MSIENDPVPDLRSPSPSPSVTSETSSAPPSPGRNHTSNGSNTGGKRLVKGREKEKMESRLLEDSIVTFNKEFETLRERNKEKILPESFWRTSYEGSKTPTAFNSTDNQIKHREAPNLKLFPENAYQTVAAFSATMDLNRERFQRTMITNKVVDPPSCMTMYKGFEYARKHAEKQYHKSKSVGHRCHIGKISSEGFVAATITGTMETLVTRYIPRIGKDNILKETVYRFPVRIPIWVCLRNPSDYQRDIPIVEFEKLGAEVWIAAHEINQSNVVNGPERTWYQHQKKNYPDPLKSRGNRNIEWFAAGAIPKSRVVQVVPYDGKNVHWGTDKDRIIISLEETNPWIWDWDISQWVEDQAKFDEEKQRRAAHRTALEERNAQRANKRPGDQTDSESSPTAPARRRKLN